MAHKLGIITNYEFYLKEENISFGRLFLKSFWARTENI